MGVSSSWLEAFGHSPGTLGVTSESREPGYSRQVVYCISYPRSVKAVSKGPFGLLGETEFGTTIWALDVKGLISFSGLCQWTEKKMAFVGKIICHEFILTVSIQIKDYNVITKLTEILSTTTKNFDC